MYWYNLFFDYDCTPWFSNLSKKLIARFQATQNKCMRFCLQQGKMSRIWAKKFLELNWFNVPDRYLQFIVSHILKFYGNQCPDYFVIWVFCNTSYKLRVSRNWKVRVQIQELRVQINKFKFTSYEFNLTSYKFKSRSYEFKSTSYEFKSTSYKFKSSFKNHLINQNSSKQPENFFISGSYI